MLSYPTLPYPILFYHHLLLTIAMLSDCIISLSNCGFTESATISLCPNTRTLQLILRLSLILPNVLLYPSDFSSYPSYDMMHLTSSYPTLSFHFGLWPVPFSPPLPIQCHLKIHYTILCYTILHCAILYYAIPLYTMIYYAMLYYATPYYTALHYTTPHSTILYYAIPYYTTLYYTKL